MAKWPTIDPLSFVFDPAFINPLIPHKLKKFVHTTFDVCVDHDGEKQR